MKNTFPHPHFSEGLEGDTLLQACVQEAERLRELAGYLAAPEDAPWLAQHLRDSLEVFAGVLGRLHPTAHASPQGPLPTPAPQSLLQRRLAYLAELLFEPESALAEIDDPVFKQTLHAGRFPSCNRLFTALALLEETRLGTVFQGEMAGTIRIHLVRAFKLHGWAWPRTVGAWGDFLRTWQEGEPLVSDAPVATAPAWQGDASTKGAAPVITADGSIS